MNFKLYFKNFTEMGYHLDDSAEEKVNKSSLSVLSIPFAAAGLIWGILYFINGLLIPGSIPFSYGILSILSFVNFSITKKYKFFRNSQLFLILLLPFLLQLSLGGFIASSAVIIWALIAPIGSLVFFKTKQSIYWFIAYIFLVIIALLINDFVAEYFNWNLNNEFINIVFLLNIIAVSSLIYAVMYYYVGKQTELKEAIEEKNTALEVQTEKLKELDKVKATFFANISHEFRTPLTVILGLINKQITKPESVNPNDSKSIKRNAQRLLQLINQLLDLSKIESGEVKLNITKQNILSFTKKIILLFESFAKEKNINITFNKNLLDKEFPIETISVNIDKERFSKILTNLISNAIKFTPKEGNIEINIFTENKDVIIDIANSGDGIPAKNLPYIFNRFYQVDDDSTREYDGTGIGLALVKELVELHKGVIDVESNLNRTTFSIKMPIDLPIFENESVIEQPIEDSILENISIQSKNADTQQNLTQIENDIENLNDHLEILVVEDNEDIRDYINDILDKDYKVIQAVDGLDGLKKAEASIPDLIISDVMMPNMDGYELCKHLKTNEKTNHIPVILLTAKASQENKLEGLETGADDYLIKPFDEKELMTRIKNLISLREKLQKKYQQGAWLKSGINNITSVQQKFIENIKDIIEKNIDNSQYSVEDLGEAIAMSRSQVHRKLKAITDQSATQFIRNYRLHRAAELIKLDSGNITEIAYQVGFSSQTYFSKCFQELFECSPSEYKTN